MAGNQTLITDGKFDWQEYMSFGFNFTLPILFGLFFGLKNRRKNTINKYLLGGKKMSIFPVTMSLMASFLSCGIFLSVPADIYNYGAQYMMVSVIIFLISIVGAFIFLPLLYKLQLINIYEYFEQRFCKTVRTIATVLFITRQLTAVPGTIYGLSIAFNQFTNVSFHLTTLVICTVCTFYTTIGGFVAIVWADTVQGIIMAITVVTIVVFGVYQQGGFTIIENAIDGQRTKIFNMNPDPRIRISFWTSTIGFFIHYCGVSVVYPSFVQRYISLPKENDAKWAILFFGLLTFLILTCASFIGMIAYSRYKECDPYTAQLISKLDQIIPYYVMDTAKGLPGIAGLFFAGIACAALSTMSTSLNTAAGIIFQDTVDFFGLTEIGDARSYFYIKCIVAVLGFICLGVTYVIENLGTLIVMLNLFDGLTGGISLGLFILGGFLSRANATGALCGGLSGILVSVWLITGYIFFVSNRLIQYEMPPVSISECPFNVTSLNKTTNNKILDADSIIYYIFPLAEVSVFYYSTICFLTTVILGITVSYLSGNNSEEINPDLLFPIARKYCCKKRRIYEVAHQNEDLDAF